MIKTYREQAVERRKLNDARCVARKIGNKNTARNIMRIIESESSSQQHNAPVTRFGNEYARGIQNFEQKIISLIMQEYKL